MNIIWLAFLTGLTTGGISCLAVQGGLLASATTPADGEKVPVSKKLLQVAMFIATKLAGYTLLGFLLGFLGSALILAPKALGHIQILAGLFMAATALRLIDAHPIFRYIVITPPRWAFRLLKRTSQRESLFAPAILGLFTVFLPCGVTQATMAIAIASGNPFLGAVIMAAFVLGTSPIFFVLGATVVELLRKKAFSYAAAAIIGIFAVLSINGGVGLTGSPYTFQNFYRAATTSIDELSSGTRAPLVNGMQDVTVVVEARGYTASATILKRGIPVRVTLTTNNTLGCARAFTIPDFGISKVLPVTGRETIEFTPQKAGRLGYSCSMGMYTGAFIVEE